MSEVERTIPESTFVTRGVSVSEAKRYLATEEGEKFLSHLINADPLAPDTQIDERAIEQLSSGRTLPRLETINEPLVKIVPAGTKVSDYSPFFTRQSTLDAEVAAGRHLADRFGLPLASESGRYDVYRITPKGPTEVFVTDIAPTSELGGRVAHTGGAVQVVVPNRAQFSSPELINAIEDPTHVSSLVASARAAEANAAQARALSRGMVAVGVVVAAADAAHTGRGMARDYAQDNATAAEAKLIDFSARTGGGVAGAGLGFAAGSAVGTPLIGGTVGAVAGAVAGDRIAEWHHRETIYRQHDAQGRKWFLDPERPEQGWVAPVADARGMIVRNDTASSALTSELNFKASARSLELALGAPPPGANPHRLAASASDAKSDTPAPWNFDADSGQWTRQRFELRDNGMDLGQRVKIGERPDVASPERAAQLDAQSRRIIEANAAMTAPVIAARFGEAFQANGWAAHGPMPPAVAAARTRFDEVVASDGERYQRDARGQWTQDGVILQPAASPLLHRELEQTRKAAMRQAHAIDPPAQARHLAPDQRPEPEPRPAHAPRADVSRPTLPADFAPPLEQPHDLRSPLHPGHAAFNEMVHRVRVFEAQAGIPSGPHTEKLGAAVLQVAVEKKIGYQDVFFERDATTGRIDLVNRRDIHASDPPRLPLDMAKLSSRPIEVSSQGVNEAVSRHYAEPVRAQAQTRTAEQTQALAALNFDDQVMFGRLRREVPGHIGDGHVLQAMVEAKRTDIPNAASIGGVMMFGDSIRVMGKGEGAPVAQVDMSQPAPKPEVSLAAIQSQNQQQAVEQQVAQQMAQQHAQGQQQGAAMRLG